MESKALWYWEGLDLFGKFCPVKMGHAEHAHERRSFQSGELIYRQADPPSSLYFIERGRVRIGSFQGDGNDTTKALLREGEVFGEMVIAGEASRSDFAQALEDDVQICVIPWDGLQALMKDDAELSLRLVKWMGYRMRRMERRLEVLAFKDARTRIVEFLRDAAAFKGKKIGDEVLIRTKLTHKDIAALTATSRQTVSETLNDLRRENQIFFERGKILLRDLDQLK